MGTIAGANAEHLDDDHWWATRSRLRSSGAIISKFAGRSQEVRRSEDFSKAYRDIRRLLTVTGVKRELRLREYYEKPSEKKVRLASERHRKRFAKMVGLFSLPPFCEAITVAIVQETSDPLTTFQIREKVEIVALYKSRQ
jgi:ribosomal protein S21